MFVYIQLGNTTGRKKKTQNVSFVLSKAHTPHTHTTLRLWKTHGLRGNLTRMITHTARHVWMCDTMWWVTEECMQACEREKDERGGKKKTSSALKSNWAVLLLFEIPLCRDTHTQRECVGGLENTHTLQLQYFRKTRLSIRSSSVFNPVVCVCVEKVLLHVLQLHCSPQTCVTRQVGKMERRNDCTSLISERKQGMWLDFSTFSACFCIYTDDILNVSRKEKWICHYYYVSLVIFSTVKAETDSVCYCFLLLVQQRTCQATLHLTAVQRNYISSFSALFMLHFQQGKYNQYNKHLKSNTCVYHVSMRQSSSGWTMWWLQQHLGGFIHQFWL